ncbi:hypothetical protein G3T36_10670 [Diaminobutyricibacter tongyongensis]|uniref:Uncharacterized protein n=1 Tax=Leifsonia tongyongensis TaxID=1268043 RepID=A0A6L9XY32_9MICO|nr:hypothetical protein [Diaminobutyricibacter tongyongensis]NEN06339.1 hypothetical protein [Diaminobutyricibacter tongyongensis]
MGMEFSGLDDIGDFLNGEGERLVAENLAQVARQNGQSNVDNIALELEGNDGTFDEARIRALANEILAEPAEDH